MAVNSELLLVIKSSALGEGEADLGERLMGAFLGSLLESGSVPARVIFMNSGIFLTTQETPVLAIIRQMEEAGAEIRSCGTCLDYYGRRNALLVGSPGNMKETVSSLMSYPKVIVP